MTLVTPETMLSIQPVEYRPWWDYASTADLSAAAKAKTPKSIAKALGIAWGVEEAPVFAKVGDRYIEVPGKKAITRADNSGILSVMGSRYHRLQNEVLVDFAMALAGEGAEIIGSGTFRDGAVVWVQVLLPKKIKVPGEDSPIEPYLLVYTSHDGSRPFGAILTTIRVWCQNTFNAAIRGAKTRFSIRHTPNATQRFVEAKRVLGLSYDSLDIFEKAATVLTKKKMTLADVQAFTETLLPTRRGEADDEDEDIEGEKKEVRVSRIEEDRETIARLFVNGSVMGDMPLTRYRALQAVTEWADHHREYRASAGNRVSDNKALSLLDGQAARLKGRAFDLLLN